MRYLHLIPIISSLLLCYPAQAVQPMTEGDLDIVSADIGTNILNIMGAPAAGISDDTLETSSYKESESAEPVAQQQVKEIEENNLASEANTDSIPKIDQQSIESIYKEVAETTRAASAFSTSSEMKYRTDAAHHEMQQAQNGGVRVERDLHIDSLSFENLRGDGFDDGRTAGSVFLSDWISRGSTFINVDQR